MKPFQQHLGSNLPAENLKGNSSAQQPPGILSALSLSDWRGSLTVFRDFWGTRPVGQLVDATWSKILFLLSPERPAIIAEKANGRFFLPCGLKEAPLTGRTLEAAQTTGQPTVGKMRSREHVTEASMLVMDIDGLAEADFLAGLARLGNDGSTFVAYSTFSYRSADKADMRARLIVPLDGALDAEGYRAAWRGLDDLYWHGQAGKADRSGACLCQQQGLPCCHPDRVDTACWWANSGGVASAGALRKLGERSSEAPRVRRNGARSAQAKGFSRFASHPGGDAKLPQLTETISRIDPDSQYDDWLLVLAVVFNETGGSEAGFALANEWSSAGEKYKGKNEIRQKWRSFDPDHPNPAKLGSLTKMLRDADRGVKQ